jgi:protein SCO1/2
MRLVLVIAAGALALAIGILLVASQIGGGDSGGVAAGASAFTGSVPPAGIELPAFALTDETGASVTGDDLRGGVSVVTFLDAQCTAACPVIGEIAARAVDRLDAEERGQVTVVGISVDPAEDTRDEVEAFLRRHRAVGRISYLVGDEAALTPLWRDFGVLSVVVSGDDDIHSAPVRIYSRDGEWLSTLHSGADLTVDALVHDIRVALDENPASG